MGLHEEIDKAEQRIRGFRWPKLKRVTSADQKRNDVQARLKGLSVELGTSGSVLKAGEVTWTSKGCLKVAGSVGDRSFTIAMPEDFLQVLLEVYGCDQDIAVLCEKRLALVLEHLLSLPISRLESLLDLPITLTEVSVGKRPKKGFGMFVEIPDRPQIPVLLKCDDALIDRISNLLPTGRDLPIPKALNDTKFSVSLMAPDLTLSVRDYEALELGDALTLDPAWRKPSAFRLRVADFLTGSIEPKDGKLRQKGPFEYKTSHNKETMDMTTLAEAPAQHSASPIENLPVTISVELDRKEMNLAEVRALTEGAVLPFSTDLPSEVTLMVNGSAIAVGELVQLDDRFGVRVVRFV
ncbi:type III secretion system cytoplasmic ring protein SctQ [Aestuariibius insulae]|uniref:type III secretion system cytoplasmic ring protein SctQ n=1 Tax=Aestuariibius insulae TaxID=2058287 RepID=UPI00345EB51F